MAPLDQKLRKATSPQNDSKFPKKTVFNAKINSVFEKWTASFDSACLEFRRFLLEVSICCTMEIYNEGRDISSCPNTTNTRIFIIFKTSAISSHVGKN